MTPTKPLDDLDALRAVIDAVKDFKSDEQQRIFRWAAEKLGLAHPFGVASQPTGQAPHVGTPPATHVIHSPATTSTTNVGQNIKSFVEAKNPRNDVQFAATVAYFFRFEGPQSERKDSIDKDDLQDACRKSGRDRLTNPAQTLRNAHKLGLLDKTAEAGRFAVNTVGENLVAMTLPKTDGKPAPKKKRAKKTVAKKAKKA